MVHPSLHGTLSRFWPGIIVALLAIALTRHAIHHSQSYGVVVDAGSSGTRVYVFRWREANPAESITQIFSKRWRPGLSSLATPQRVSHAGALEAATEEELGKVLATAASKVPSADHSQTPILLKATAGLRLLPESQRNRILTGARAALRASPFVFQDSWAGLIDGQLEAVYMWTAANVLAGRFLPTPSGGDATAGTLDLGGGSTQITLPLRTSDDADREEAVLAAGGEHALTVRTWTEDDVKWVRTLFGVSFLGFGQNEAFDSFLEWSASNGHVTDNPCLLVGQKERVPSTSSDDPVTVKGPSSKSGSKGVPGHQACAELVDIFLDHLVDATDGARNKLDTLKTVVEAAGGMDVVYQEFVASDNYPKDTLALFTLVVDDDDDEGDDDTIDNRSKDDNQRDLMSDASKLDGETMTVMGTGSKALSDHARRARSVRVTRRQLLSRAGLVCPQLGWSDVQQQLKHMKHDRNRKLCFGAAYISNLLQRFQFELDTDLLFAERINGFETNWPLGAMAHHIGVISI